MSEHVTLPTNEATVQERQVTIRVLTVGAKQVTQTLYRQLVWEDVIDPQTGCLAGDVWGWVNVHIGCDTWASHTHAIWETQGQLKRSVAYDSPTTSDHYSELRPSLSHLAILYVCLVSLADKRFTGKITRQDGSSIYLTVKGRKIKVNVPEQVEKLWSAPEDFDQYCERRAEQITDVAAERREYMERRKQAVRDYIVIDLRPYIKGGPDRFSAHAQVYAEMEEVASELTNIEENWAKSYKAIQQAGQLFIAVSGVWK